MCSQWQGVWCNDRARIAGIDIEGSSADGTLPEFIGDLVSLTYLDLSGNSLTGPLPSSLSKLTNLVTLDLSHNYFSSSIPDSFWDLTNLQYLDLGHNWLESDIPGSIGGLPKLTYLDIGDNSFNQDLPWFLGDLLNLEYLDLNEAGFTGGIPDSFSNLVDLTYLDVSGNKLEGYMPDFFGQLTNLVVLHMQRNSFLGDMPYSLRALTKLTDLDLSRNQLSGDILPYVGEMASLVSLDLSHNDFSSSIPEGITQLLDLTYLDLRGNELTGGIPYGIWSMSSLIELDVSYNQLSDAIPDTIMQLSRLTSLELQANSFSFLPSGVSQLSNLQELDVSMNSIGGEIPATIGALTKLTALYLGRNNFIGGIPDSFTALINLRYVSINRNSLTSPLPAAIGNLRNLLDLDLSGNQMTGSLPTSVSRLVNLTSLDLSSSDDGFSGTIPNFFAPLTKLVYLTLGSNRFEGSLPPTLSLLSNLKYLGLYSNSFTSIPIGLSRLTALTEVDLSNNKFVGSFPLFISTLSNLVVLDLGSNSFDGPLPDIWSQLTALTKLILQNCGLTNSIPPSLSRLPILSQLDLSDNQLNDPLPATISNFNVLTSLDLSNNVIPGAIPRQLGLLSTLVYLNLGDNALDSSIPAELSGLQNLRELYLYDNKLSDKIPPQLQALLSLETLDLCPNQLSGFLPSELGLLTNLKKLILCDNLFFGSVPDTIPTLPQLAILDLSSNQLTGNLPNYFASSTIAQTADGALNLAWNYFYGDASVTLNDGTEFCPRNNDGPDGIYGSIDGNCLTYSDNYPSDCAHYDDSQRSLTEECPYFCGLSDSNPPCGSNGVCYLDGPNKIPTCSCNEGFQTGVNDPGVCEVSDGGNASPPPPEIVDPNAFTRGLALPLLSPTRKGRYFRYASSGFTRDANGDPSWRILTNQNWKNSRFLTAISDQGSCSACWAFAATSAISSAIAISRAAVSSAAPPDISVQQQLDCMGGGTCAGGWPGDAFEYFSAGSTAATADKPLPFQAQITTAVKYPYLGSDSPGTCDASKASGGTFSISMYEEANFYGWFGLLLALQSQPAVAYIQSTSDGFLNYKGRYVFQDPDCFTDVVDHAVLVVGYKLVDRLKPPYWTIRNSWGPDWGDGGYMDLAITGGDGICGINTMPPLLPLIRSSGDPCLVNSFNGGMNPCGGGSCSVDQATGRNRCFCPPTFTAATNIDGSQTCVPIDVCGLTLLNPCNVGSCANDGRGGYACVCPLGYANGFKPDNSPTCVPAALTVGTRTLSVSSGVNCERVYSLYGLTKASFQQQNPGVDCSQNFASDTIVSVTPPSSFSGCALPYVAQKDDTCQSIADIFEINTAQLKQINPWLDCTQPITPQLQVCITIGEPIQMPYCSQIYLVEKTDSTCEDIWRNARPPITPREFFILNPGINCANLNPPTGTTATPGLQVCLSAAGFGALRCTYGSYFLRSGDRSCTQLIGPGKKFKNYFIFQQCNRGFLCIPLYFFTGQKICLPNTRTGVC